jgi:hypothetical protein
MKVHGISYDLRTKMIDWMVEVTSTFKMEKRTLFLAIHIIDTYYAKQKVPAIDKDIHLTGIVAMHLASKYEDLIPISQDVVYNKIGHKAFSLKVLKQKEIQILTTMDFQLSQCLETDFIDILIQSIKVFEETKCLCLEQRLRQLGKLSIIIQD